MQCEEILLVILCCLLSDPVLTSQLNFKYLSHFSITKATKPYKKQLNPIFLKLWHFESGKLLLGHPVDEYNWHKIDEIMTKSMKIIDSFPSSFQTVNLPVLMGNNLYQPIQIDHEQTSAVGIFALIFKTKWLLQRYFHKDTSNKILPLGLYRLIVH